MVRNILDNITNLNKEKEFTLFQIKTFIWEVGNRINFMDKECIFIQTMDKNIKENLVKDLNLAEVYIHINLGLFIKVNGLKIEKVDLEFILIKINKDIKGIG